MKQTTSFLSLFLIFMMASGCTSSDLQSSINKVWEEEVFVPVHDKYPIGLSYVEYLPIIKDGKTIPDGGEPWLINIMYFSKDEKSSTGNDHINHWKENDALKEFIYENSYQNQFMVGLSIKKMGNDSIHPEQKEIEIDGHKVLYYFGLARDKGNFVYLGINFEHLDYGYAIMHRIDENNTEEDAIEFARYIIENNK
jgi:hypothetical protein